MAKPLKFPKKVELNQRRKKQVFGGLLLFATLGSILVLVTRAASPNIAFQSESATRSGSVELVNNDSSASGGSYVLFKGSGGGNGIGGSGADMTPGRKCADSSVTANAATINGGNLQAAIDSLSSGGVLVVNAGTYSPISISGKSNITICGAPGSRPKIDATNNTGVSISGSSYIHFEGFEVAGSQGNDLGIRVFADSHHVSIWDNWVRDMGSAGIAASNGYCGHIDFRYNTIWNTSYHDGWDQSAITIYEPRNCGGGPDVGIYSDFIIGNVAYHNGALTVPDPATDGNCIIWDDTKNAQQGNHSEGPYTGYGLIANNLCVGNGGRGVHIGPTAANADVINNTDYYNMDPEFRLSKDAYGGQMDASASDNVRFINNVSIARPDSNAFDVWNSNNIFKSNNIFNRVTRDESGGGGYTLMDDPGFTNPSEDPNTWDFRPRSGSPLINAGIGSYSNVIFPNVDITGKPRSTTSPSIGAFEP